MSRSRPSGERPPLSPHLRLLVGLVVCVLFVDTVFYSAITPLLPYDVRHQGLSTLGAGLLVAGYPAGTLLAALPSGLLAARRGARTAVLVGVLLTGVSTVAFGWAHGLPLLVGSRLVEGAAGSCSWAGALAWLAVQAPAQRRGELMGTAYGAAAAGAVLGPALGGLAAVVGPAWAFSGAGISAGLLAVAALRLAAPQPEPHLALRAALPRAADPGVRTGAGLVALAGLCFGVIDVLAPLRLGRLGATPVEVAVIFLAGAGVETLTNPRVGRLSDRHGPHRPLRIALLGAVLVAVLAPVVSPLGALVPVIMISGPVFAALFAPATALMAEGAQRAGLPQGLAAAGLNLVWALGMAGAAAGSGALASVSSPLVPYLLLALACAAGWAALRRQRGAGLAGDEPTDRRGELAGAAGGPAQTPAAMAAGISAAPAGKR